MFTLRHELGGRASGGLDALLSPEAFGGPRAGALQRGRWTSEASWGFETFRGRFIGSPSLGYANGVGGRDLSLGWRIVPNPAANGPELSVGLMGIRREAGSNADPEHGVQLELLWRW